MNRQHCGVRVVSDRNLLAAESRQTLPVRIWYCGDCTMPTFDFKWIPVRNLSNNCHTTSVVAVGKVSLTHTSRGGQSSVIHIYVMWTTWDSPVEDYDSCYKDNGQPAHASYKAKGN